MNLSAITKKRLTLDPALRNSIILFSGLCLSVPSGMILVRLLSYQLSAQDYGILGITSSIVFWLELSTTQLFGRAIVRLISVSDNWLAEGSALLRLQLAVGLAVMALVILAAPGLANLLRAPELARTLPLLALDIPLYSLAQAQGALLVARGRIWSRSSLYMLRWTVRLVLVVVYLIFGYGLEAPLRGYVSASVIEVIVGFILCRVSLFRRAHLKLGELFRYTVPVWIYTVTFELFRDLDLMMVQATQPGAAAGYYAAVQYLVTLSDLLAASLSPILISTIAIQRKENRHQEAAQLVRNSIWLVVSLLPFTGLAAGAAAQIIPLIYAPTYRAAAPALAVLLIGSVGTMLIIVTTSILVALDLPGWTAVFAALLIPLALVAHALIVPAAGIVGAALVTTALSWVVGLVIGVAACRRAQTVFPVRGLLLAVILTPICFYLSRQWVVEGWTVLFKLAAMCLLLALVYLALPVWRGYTLRRAAQSQV